MKTKFANKLLLAIVAIASVTIFFMAPIPQDPHYHNFADQRSLCNINHFWNVLSNLPFLLVGIYGLWHLRLVSEPSIKPAYAIFCSGVILVCLGSGYYHLAPDNHSLVWDRLPMTIAFMAFISIVLHERVLLSAKNYTLIPLLVIGLISVAYWSWTETQGRGDLRLYILVQFIPVILIPLIIYFYPRRYLSSGYLLLAFVFYFLAKILEHFDANIYQLLGVMSGHSLKHLSAAIAVFCIIQSFFHRRLINANH
jgi:hypothetical protein